MKCSVDTIRGGTQVANHALILTPGCTDLSYALDSGAAGGLTTESDAVPADLGTHHGPVLICVRCKNLVTRTDFITEISGNTVHTCTNPHGFTYTFRTFIAAPGCTQMGEPTTDHSWFPPFAWQLANCAGCREHLGWRFRRTAGEMFYALIDERLVEEQMQ